MEFTKENLALIVALAAVVGSVVAAAASALSTLAVTWLTKRSEERKHFRELVVNVAYKNWEKLVSNVEKTPGGGYVYPVDDFILIMSKTADLILDKNLNSENIEAKLEEISAMNMKMRQHRDKQLELLKKAASNKSMDGSG